MGDRIPVEKFHVSELNIRAGHPFGEAEEDQLLIENLRRGRIIGPFKARPEGDSYGVYVGRRRFLAKKTVGVKHFVVGKDCLIEDVDEEEARVASLTENLRVLQKDLDPVTKAKKLNEIISFSAGGLRATARQLGLKPSTLSEWLKPLELSPKMQEVTAKGTVFFTDALQVAKMNLGTEKQDKLAEIAETEGLDAFKAEVERLQVGIGKRGIPKGKYSFIKITIDTRYKPDLELDEKLTKLAEAKGMEKDNYCKWALSEYVKTIG